VWLLVIDIVFNVTPEEAVIRSEVRGIDWRGKHSIGPPRPHHLLADVPSKKSHTLCPVRRGSILLGNKQWQAVLHSEFVAFCTVLTCPSRDLRLKVQKITKHINKLQSFVGSST
jgi:hypothetical protein